MRWKVRREGRCVEDLRKVRAMTATVASSISIVYNAAGACSRICYSVNCLQQGIDTMYYGPGSNNDINHKRSGCDAQQYGASLELQRRADLHAMSGPWQKSSRQIPRLQNEQGVRE